MVGDAEMPVAGWRVLDSPFGLLTIVATTDGVAAVGLDDPDRTVGAAARRLRGTVVDADDPGLPQAIREQLERAESALQRSFAGEPDATAEIPVDLSGLPDWDRAVLTATRSVPRGQVSSYGRIARRAGSPRAARATGGALGRNPVWIFVPCHRVIASDGTLGGYGGGLMALDVKRALLAAEGVELPARELFD